MSSSKKYTAVIHIVYVVAVLLLNACDPTPAPCVRVKAKGKGNIISQTPTGAVTESEVFGRGLKGTTLATLQFTGSVPATGNLIFEGTLTLTARQGTLTFSIVNGLLNPTTGEFSNDAIVTAGTGAFAGSSGNLYFHGFSYPDGSFVDDEITGRICRDQSYAKIE